MLNPHDFVNLTPHTISLKNENMPMLTITIPPHQGGAVRVVSERKPELRKHVAGFDIYEKPLMTKLEGNVDTFMDAKAVIVSTMVAEFEWVQQMRPNIFAPSVIPEHTIRDQEGRIIGITALHQYS